MSPLALIAVLLTIAGRVTDAVTGTPIAGARVEQTRGGNATLTDSSGRFTLASEGAGPIAVKIRRTGYADLDTTLAPSGGTVELRLTPVARALEAVTVSAIRGLGETPVSATEVTKRELEVRYSGQEIPLLLALTPSITAYADGGAYSNYTYLRIRGIDATRINMTLDGIPLNDAEDQGVFFSNFPDFANSLQSVQVQRGVGTSSNGTAAFAGSVNFESIALRDAPRQAEAQLTGGSFDSRRGSLEYQTGMLKSRFAGYARLSFNDTDGFRFNSGNQALGGFASAGYFGDRTSLKLTGFSGVSRNREAYLAASEAEIAEDPRTNSLHEGDRFWQQLVGLTLTQLVGDRASFSATAYRVDAGGNYDVRLDPTLVENFNLRSAVTGILASWNQAIGPATVSVGAHANGYWRDHFGYDDPTVVTYFNTGFKNEASGFAKASIEAGRVTLFGDLLVRRVTYRYHPDPHAGITTEKTAWTFFNPKIGATVHLSPSLTGYASYGTTGREPARNDMFAGFDNLDTTNVAFVGAFDRVKPERVHDIEAGLGYRSGDVTIAANLYLMNFRNEIAPIGALSYIGLPLRKNVPKSYRRGLEVDITWQASSKVTARANATLSRNRISAYTDDATGVTYTDVEPLLTPAFFANQSITVRPSSRVDVTVDGRYLGKSFLANTGDRRFMTPRSYGVDATVAWRFSRFEALGQVRNLTNRLIITGGYTDGVTSYFYLQATRNYAVTLRARI
ncbi:MAG: TonB-dependent receptor [Gemmatimonadota bacterium]